MGRWVDKHIQPDYHCLEVDPPIHLQKRLGCQDDEGGERQVAEEGVEGVHQDDQRLLHLGTSGWSDHYNCCLDQLLLFLLFRPMLL